MVDGEGVNFGSGTVIASRPGWSLVVTCGHIFRQLTKDSRIEVDLFIDGRSETFVGSVVQYDLEADVGLIKIPTETAFPSVPLADLSNRPTEGAAVFSIGCGGGEPPTRQDLTVTSLNRYLGPANIECSGVPVQGRSGGGLFNPDGELVGVCVAADPHDRRGLYAALSCVDELLDRCQLTEIVRADSPTRMPVATEFADSEPSRFENASRTEVPADLPARPVGDSGRVPSGWSIAGEQTDAAETPNTPPVGVERSAGSELDALLATVGDAEVVCIIRPRNQPNAPSRVVVINRASPKFVSYLTGEVADDDQGVAGTTTGLQPESVGGTTPPVPSRSREQMQPSMQETSHRVNGSADSGYGHSEADRLAEPTVEEVNSLRSALPSAIRPQRYQRSR